MNPRWNDRKSATAAVLLAAGLALAATGLAADPVEVAIARPVRGDITRFVALPGTLRANQQVTVQARVAGFVKSISVDRGDRVAAGQVLAEVEVPELLAERVRRVSEAKVAEAEARRLDAARQKAPDLVTPQAFDAAAGRLEVARAELEKTDTLLRYATITAPFAGTITARFVDTGAFVPAGAAGGASAMVTLADTAVLRAQVAVPETEAVLLKVGQPVRVSVEGLVGAPLAATVTRQSGALDESTRTLWVEADLPNAGGVLRPGMFATVRIGVERHAGALLVPTDAVLVERGAASVFRLDGGLGRKTAVKLGFQDGAQTEILSGIAEDAVLVANAKTAPPDGVAIRAREAR